MTVVEEEVEEEVEEVEGAAVAVVEDGVASNPEMDGKAAEEGVVDVVVVVVEAAGVVVALAALGLVQSSQAKERR